MSDAEITITVYSKANCQPCAATKRKLSASGIPFREVRVDLDEEALEKATADGFLEAPVVYTPRGSWSGFRPDLIDALAKGEL